MAKIISKKICSNFIFKLIESLKTLGECSNEKSIYHEMGIKMTPMPAPFVAKAKAIWKPLQAKWMAKAKEKGVDGEAALAMMKSEIAKVEAGK